MINSKTNGRMERKSMIESVASFVYVSRKTSQPAGYTVLSSSCVGAILYLVSFSLYLVPVAWVVDRNECCRNP
jgi:hypothetical protein